MNEYSALLGPTSKTICTYERWSPHKFSSNDIYNIFALDFQINDIKKTILEGTLDPLPKAMFTVMKLIK